MIRIPQTETIVTADAILRRKCRLALDRHRAAAKQAGVKLDYSLRDLERLAGQTQQCAYCRAPLGYDFEFDHAQPLARGGAHALDNLVLAHVGCNQAKGMLDAENFLALRRLLLSFHPTEMTDVLRRLRAGGRRYQGNREKD